MSAKNETVTSLPEACADEHKAAEFLELMRWGTEPCCPRCGDCNTYQMKDRKSGERNSRFLWRCRGCGKQYTVRVGTVMEDSPIALRHWVFTFWSAAASKKGVSALQIHRMTGVSYKSALFMMHRVRWAMRSPNAPEVSGDVEADETYVGGKPRHGNMERVRGQGPAPDFKDRKTPVFAAVEREGSVRTRVLTDVTALNLRRAVYELIQEEDSRLITDERIAYRKAGTHFRRGHETVNHGQREYARGEINTNTVESFFALLKRGLYGVFHNVSKKHLARYVQEFEFRWNTRGMDDAGRLAALVRAGEGKRLTYSALVG